SAPDGLATVRPRSPAPQTRGARPKRRTWHPKTRIASERTRARAIPTRLEVVAGREAIHAIQKLGLRHRSVIDPDAPVVEPQPIGEVLDRSTRIVDVARPERHETVELELAARVFNPGAVRKERPVDVRHEEHLVGLLLEGGHGDAELRVPSH